MSTSFRICLIIPPGYQHAACFLEIAILLKHAISDNGFLCEIVPNELSNDKINIILGVHLLSFGDHLKNIRYIPYQLEQLSEKEGVFNETLFNVLKNAEAVWDYSLENISFLKSKGIDAELIPPGYHASLEQIPEQHGQEYDALFYGSVGPRRAEVLNSLSKLLGPKLKVSFGVYGQNRDTLIAQSKIILNIHHYSARIFEAVRISYLLNNKCFVLTEDSAVNPYPQVDIAHAPYELLAQTTIACLQTPKDLNEKRVSSYEQFKKNYLMSSIVLPSILKLA